MGKEPSAGVRVSGFDNDYYQPQKAVVVAPSRSGGTWLCHCLDSHYQIGCERDEPLSPRRSFAKLNAYHGEIMNALWDRGGYRVTMFKVTYRQLGDTGPEILQHNKVKVVHLYRRNGLRVLVSSLVNTAAVNGEIDYPLHSFEATEAQRVTVNAGALVTEIERYLDNIELVTRQLAGLLVKELHYEQLIGRDGGMRLDRQYELCKFFDIIPMPMRSDMVRLNPEPLNELIANYGDVEAVLKPTKYRWMLDG